MFVFVRFKFVSSQDLRVIRVCVKATNVCMGCGTLSVGVNQGVRACTPSPFSSEPLL